MLAYKIFVQKCNFTYCFCGCENLFYQHNRRYEIEGDDLETSEIYMNLTEQEKLKTHKMLWGEFPLCYSKRKALVECAEPTFSSECTKTTWYTSV